LPDVIDALMFDNEHQHDAVMNGSICDGLFTIVDARLPIYDDRCTIADLR
jgi:hypothetical protein